MKALNLIRPKTIVFIVKDRYLYSFVKNENQFILA